MSKLKRSRSVSPPNYQHRSSDKASTYSFVDDTIKQLPYGHLSKYAEDKHVAMRMRQIAANRRANSVSPLRRSHNGALTARHRDLRAALYSLLHSSFYKIRTDAATNPDLAVEHRYNGQPHQPSALLCSVNKTPRSNIDCGISANTAKAASPNQGHVQLSPHSPGACAHQQDSFDDPSLSSSRRSHNGSPCSNAHQTNMTAAIASKGGPYIGAYQTHSRDSTTSPRRHRCAAGMAGRQQPESQTRRSPQASKVLPSKEKVTLSITSPSGRPAGIIEYPTTWTNPMVMEGSLSDTSGSSTKDAMYMLRHTQRALQDTLSELQTARSELGRAARQHARGQQYQHEQKHTSISPACSSPHQATDVNELRAHLQETKEREHNARRQALQLIADNLELVARLEAIQQSNQVKENASAKDVGQETGVQTKSGSMASYVKPTSSLRIDKAASIVETPMEEYNRLLCMHDVEASPTVLATTVVGDVKSSRLPPEISATTPTQLEHQPQHCMGHNNCLTQLTHQLLTKQESISLIPRASQAMRIRYHEPYSPESTSPQAHSLRCATLELPASTAHGKSKTVEATEVQAMSRTFEQHESRQKSQSMQNTEIQLKARSCKQASSLIQGQPDVDACSHQGGRQGTANVTTQIHASNPQCIESTRAHVSQDPQAQGSGRVDRPLDVKAGNRDDDMDSASVVIDTCHCNTAVQASNGSCASEESTPTPIHDGCVKNEHKHAFFRHQARLLKAAALSCATALLVYHGLMTMCGTRHAAHKHRHAEGRCCADLGCLHG